MRAYDLTSVEFVVVDSLKNLTLFDTNEFILMKYVLIHSPNFDYWESIWMIVFDVLPSVRSNVKSVIMLRLAETS